MAWCRLGWGATFACASAAIIVACTGDDPALIIFGDDAGEEDAASSPQNDAASNPIEDSGKSGEDAGDAETPYDAGSPIWQSSLPDGGVTSLSGVGNTTCTIDLVAVQTVSGPVPPQWQVYLRKTDASGVTCNEPKGVRALGNSYTIPVGRLLKPYNADQIVVAYTTKPQQSGSSPQILRMLQIDWSSGNDVHEALMKTKTVMGAPMYPPLSLEQLFFADQQEQAAGTVRLLGSGAFPGETGTGTYFLAKYVSFIGPQRQLASAADECIRRD